MCKKNTMSSQAKEGRNLVLKKSRAGARDFSSPKIGRLASVVA